MTLIQRIYMQFIQILYQIKQQTRANPHNPYNLCSISNKHTFIGK